MNEVKTNQMFKKVDGEILPQMVEGKYIFKSNRGMRNGDIKIKKMVKEDGTISESYVEVVETFIDPIGGGLTQTIELIGEII